LEIDQKKEASQVKKTARFVIWICSKFTREEIEQIIQGLFDVLANRNPEVKPKDDFKEKHPNYRNFFVDPEPPLKTSPETTSKSDWKELLSNYEKKNGHNREYHFTQEELKHSAPKEKDSSSLFKIYNSLNTLCLALTFHISLGISARKTAFILRNVFKLPISYQSILNYTEMAAPYCHRFNLANKGEVDNTQAGDETYIKIGGKTNYVFFFISSKSRKITAYHIDGTRGTLPAVISMNEAVRTAKPEQEIVLVTDGNPSYPAGIHFINQTHEPNLTHKKVIGLQNLDSESEEYRPFKELIERLNRTYKYHIRSAYGFNYKNGAVALTTLFVTHYNFLRPHISLNYSVPIPLEPLKDIDTLQGKWAKIIHLATEPSLN